MSDRMESRDVGTLESLGWSPAWSALFEEYGRAGCFPGRISVEHRGLYHFYGEGGEGTASVSGRFRHEAVRRADFPAVGDWVALRQAAEGQAVIHALLPRRNKFSRQLPGGEAGEQIFAANLDALFLVTSLNRDLNPRRVERYLASASAWGVEAVLVLNKSDLCDDREEAAARIRGLFPGLAVHLVSAHTGDGLDGLSPYLGSGRTAALVGSSGVGKSTLLNRLLGEPRQSIQEIRAGDDRGRHTTTHREMIRLPRGGLLIDNPGIRELQLWDEGVDLDGTFRDVTALAQQCRYRDCSHQHETGCAVQEARANGLMDAGRFDGYLKLRRELAYQETQEDVRAELRRKDQVKKIHRAMNKQMRSRNRR